MSTFSPEEDGFAAALHQAAGALPAPNPEVLYDASVRRGRAIVRRRRTRAGMSAGFVLCGAAVLGFTLPGHLPGGPTPSGAGSTAAVASASAVTQPSPSDSAADASSSPSPSTTASASGSPDPTGAPSGGPSAGASGALSSTVMLNAFEGMLPAGSVVLQRGGDGGPMATSPNQDIVSGLWNSQVAVTLRSPGLYSYVIFSLYDGTWARSCAQAENRTGASGSCTSAGYKRGTLFTVEEPGNGTGSNPVYYYVWLSPSGYTTELSISDSSVADFQLSKSEIETILTGFLWAQFAPRLAG